jgi:hypothetical protein
MPRTDDTANAMAKHFSTATTFPAVSAASKPIPGAYLLMPQGGTVVWHAVQQLEVQAGVASAASVAGLREWTERH